MKKLMKTVVASAVALVASGAFANLPSPANPMGFEDLTADKYTVPQFVQMADDGGSTGSRYWFAVTNDKQLVDAEIATVNENDPQQGNYLSIEAGAPLYRTINAVSDGYGATFDEARATAETIGSDGIYLDTMVKFTVSSDDTFGDLDVVNDKLAITCYSAEDSNVTNILVRAGYVDSEGVTPTNYVLNLPEGFNVDAWHRLTVRAINVGCDAAPVGFVIYLDGSENNSEPLTYANNVAAGDEDYVESLNGIVKTYIYTDSKHALLPSLIPFGGNNYAALSAVGFKGTGSLDDIQFTTDPGFIDEGETVTIAWDAGVATYTVVDSNSKTLVDGEATSGMGSTNLTLDAGVTYLTVTATYATNYTNGTWTVEGEGAAIAGSTFTVANGATLNIVSMLPKFAVGETNYGTFADALAAAVEAGSEVSPATIKLLANYDEAIAFLEGYIVLDLNGKILQGGDADTYTIINSGATLTIIDSATGGTVEAPTYQDAEGAFYTDGGLTTINAGTFESTVYTDKFQDPEAPGDIVVNGGVFYDPDYDPEDTESKFYLYDYLGDGVKATYNAGYFTVGSPIIGTYNVTVTPDANATYAAAYNDGGAAVEFVNNVAAVTVGKTITITATPGSGYEYAETPTGWTAGQDGKITIEVSAEATVVIPAPTAVVIGTYSVTVTPTANATYAAAYNDGGAAVEFVNDVAAVTVGKTITITATPGSGYEYADTPTGWTAGQDGKITIEVSTEATVAIPAPTAKSSYPSYIDPTDAEETAKYTAWAAYAGVTTEQAATLEDAYLLNCKPAEVEAAKAAFKITSISYDTTQAKWVVTYTDGYNERKYNGTVTVKQYSDVGCKTESSTGTFFRATLD